MYRRLAALAVASYLSVMGAAALDEWDSKRGGPALLLVLLLSLFAASPSWAEPSANSNSVASHADAQCVNGVAEATKRAKPGDLPGCLGSDPRVVTRLQSFRPASHEEPAGTQTPVASPLFSYNVRAPPAFLI